MNIALVLSGGTGSRLGADIPKQYLEVNKKPIIAYCLETLSKSPDIDGIQIVADTAWQAQIQVWLGAADPEGKFRGFSLPGKNRQLSIYNGLKSIRQYASDTDAVLIHDAARPLLSQDLIHRCFIAMQDKVASAVAPTIHGVMPVLPMKDTVYCSEDGKHISKLLDRKTIFAGQAPEVFTIGPYWEANVRLLPEEILAINGSTEPAILAGLDMVMIPGEEQNFKITTTADLERFQEIVIHSKKGV